jgi:hypothetical protein
MEEEEVGQLSLSGSPESTVSNPGLVPLEVEPLSPMVNANTSCVQYFRVTMKSQSHRTVWNIMHTIIGSGIMALPWALSRTGFWPGIVMLVVLGYINYFSQSCLILSGTKTGSRTYENLCFSCFGWFGFYVISCAILLSSIGTMVTLLFYSFY